MPCGTRCYPAIEYACQGPYRSETLSAKFCNWVDLIALIRNQINLDLAAGETVNSDTTAALAAELVAQLDAESTVYTALDGVAGSAATANQFGIVTQINCSLLNTLVSTCSDDPLINLGVLAVAGGFNYATGNDSALLGFLCCLSNHFRSIQVFLERFAKAKACECPC